MRLPPWLHRLVLGVVVVAVLVVAAVVAGGGDGSSLSAGPSTAAETSTAAGVLSGQTTPSTTGTTAPPAETPATETPTTKTPTTKTPTTKTPATKAPTTGPPTTKGPSTTRAPAATSSRSGLAMVPLSSLPEEATETWLLIVDGGPFPYDRDGVTFQNRERLLPDEARGYYREYTVPTPGEDDRGARRLVVGGTEEIVFYTGDHYESFVEVDVDR